MRSVFVALIGTVALFGGGCDPNRSGGGGGKGGSGGTGGTGGTGGDADMLDPNYVAPDLAGTNNCGVQTFMLSKGLPPDLLIVLDRSDSMSDTVAGQSSSKWDQMTAAIGSTVTSLQSSIKFGLSTFPSDNSCGVSTSVDVQIASNAASAIKTAMSGKSPGGSTPTADGVSAGASYLATVVDPNPKYIILATDGAPTCAATGGTTTGGACTCSIGTPNAGGTACCVPVVGCVLPCGALGGGGDPVQDAINAVDNAAKAGINTFVVGIAADSTDDATLNSLADKGHTARPGTTKYYPVTSQADLVTAINTIAGQIISCTLQLGTAPPNPDLVDVVSGTTILPHDKTHSDGWDYGPMNTSIQFYGSWCTQLQTGAVTNVKAVFNCPPIM